MDATPPFVAAYVRVSTDKQDTAAQRSEIVKWLSANGIYDVVWYDDTGVSGAKMSRPAWDRLNADIEDRKIKTLVCYSIDRLSRWDDPDEYYVWRYRTKKIGVELVSIDGRGAAHTTLADRLLGLIEAEQRSAERKKIVARVTSGVRNARAVGVRDKATGSPTGDTRWGGQRLPVGAPGGPRLSQEQRAAVVAERAAGATYAALAVKYGVTVRTISKIVRDAGGVPVGPAPRRRSGRRNASPRKKPARAT